MRTSGLAGITLALVTACGGAPARPTYRLTPDPDPTTATPTADANEFVPAPAAPAPDAAEFAALSSAPTGAPVVITWRAPAVGDTRVRDVAHTALYTSTWDTGGRRQRTVRHFQIRERVAAVTGDHIDRLDIEVDDARELVEFDHPEAPLTLLAGAYQVELRDAAITVSRAGTGYPIGDREREELEGLYGADLGRDAPLLAVLRGHPLRVGEAVDLTAEEKRVAGGGDGLDVPVHLALVAMADGVARYRFAFWIDASTADAGRDVRGATIELAVEVATGRLRAVSTVDARDEASATMTSTSRGAETTTFTY